MKLITGQILVWYNSDDIDYKYNFLSVQASLNKPKNHQIKEGEPDGSYGTRRRVAMPTMFWWENREERIRLEDLRVDGRTILGKQNGCGLDLCGQGWRLVASTCEHVNEHSGSIKCRNILTS